MSLRAARRNARRAVNYNLAAPVPQIDGETFSQALNRGAAILASQATEKEALEARRVAGLEPYSDGIQMDTNNAGEMDLFTLDMTTGG